MDLNISYGNFNMYEVGFKIKKIGNKPIEYDRFTLTNE